MTDTPGKGAPARVVAVVLAAGGGTRFSAGVPGEHKLLAAFRGGTVVGSAVAHALAAGLAATWVVTGSVDLSAHLPPGVTIVDNADWKDGQATSLRVAVDRARAEGLDAIVVGLGDQPLVPAGAWRAVAGGGGPISVATYAGRRRNPVKLTSTVWPLLPREGDEGARTLMRRRPDLVEEVPCEGDPVDIDTKEDLQRWS